MFDRILIANRGEIACRIIKTAKRLGIATVAVYSDADRGALHVDMADSAVHIGAPAASDSYLSIDKIVAACKESGAQAVHPGYGFLSERAEFAQALEAAGIVFIGPNPRAIAAMGDKIESKRRAEKAKVSTVPGASRDIKSAKEALKLAKDIGFPVMLKASAGGGGKGMRIAFTADDIAESFERARSEAEASFGDGRLLIEKYITNPRHIEIQILGDKHGNIIHLGERECSLQRRNQKVIEEAPSPLLDDATRAAMGAEAIALARAVGYDSAGTVEFVAGQDRSYYFLEMNTRLQVEHPVTELVTGIDLVEQMIRIAAGERLSLRQADIALQGWAIETRVYAEDPDRNFVPSTGRLTRYRPPQELSSDELTVRNDTGVEEGGEISIHYDPMIAKLITHAPTRSAAIAGQAAALDAFYIEGIRHNIPFLSALMHHPRWQSGELSTGFIAEEFPTGKMTRAPNALERRSLVAIAAAIDHLTNLRRRQISQQIGQHSFQFTPDRVVMLDDDACRIEVTGGLSEPSVVRIFDDDGSLACELSVKADWWPGQPVWRGLVGEESWTVQVYPDLNKYTLSCRGIVCEAEVYTRREAELIARLPTRTTADMSKVVLCPMPGLVREVLVRPGQNVKAGDPLAVVEAMKMENVLRAECDGRVKIVNAAPGDNLAVDHVIIELE